MPPRAALLPLPSEATAAALAPLVVIEPPEKLAFPPLPNWLKDKSPRPPTPVVGRGPAQVGDQGRHGQPAVRPVAAADPLDRHVVAGQLGQEPGRPQVGVLAAGGGDYQPPPGPGDGDIEQPPLGLVYVFKRHLVPAA